MKPIALEKKTPTEDGFFKSVRALPGYRLEVVMQTGAVVFFDFSSRLNTVRFGKLRDVEFFSSVSTDGLHLFFEKPGSMTVKIAAKEFLDLILIDRTKCRAIPLDAD